MGETAPRSVRKDPLVYPGPSLPVALWVSKLSSPSLAALNKSLQCTVCRLAKQSAQRG